MFEPRLIVTTILGPQLFGADPAKGHAGLSAIPSAVGRGGQPDSFVQSVITCSSALPRVRRNTFWGKEKEAERVLDPQPM